MEKKQTVKQGYEKIAQRYHDQRDRFKNDEVLEALVALLPGKARVLDVGCGSGYPVLRYLVDRGFEAVGIDFSESMLEAAKRNVPEARFFNMDMTDLRFEDDSFDGLTAFYSIIHVERERHADLFEAFSRILKADGLMLVSMGSDEWEGIEEFHGVEMFWSHYSPEKSLRIIKLAGFEIIFDRVIEDGGEKHYWILARNRK